MSTDLPPPPAPRSVAGKPPLLPVLVGFWVDVLIAAGLLLSLSVAGFALWGAVRGFRDVQAAKAQGLTPSPSEVMAAIGQPGVLVQLVTALVSTATPALLLYYWRRRVTAAEQTASRAAARRASTWGWTALIAAAVFLLSNLVSVTATALGIKPVPTNLPLMEEALQQWPLALTLFAVVIAPAYEELLFRRVLFGRLLSAGRPWLGVVLSGAIFAWCMKCPVSAETALLPSPSCGWCTAAWARRSRGCIGAPAPCGHRLLRMASITPPRWRRCTFPGLVEPTSGYLRLSCRSGAAVPDHRIDPHARRPNPYRAHAPRRRMGPFDEMFRRACQNVPRVLGAIA